MVELEAGLETIANFLGEKWLSNLLGITGGFLGFYSFIDKYLLKFNPKLFIGTRVIVEQIEENNFLRINRIFLTLQVSNDRKKYGAIYDISIRIYSTDEINPDTAEYFVSEVILEMPINIEDLKKQDYKYFNPISVDPESSKSVHLVFSDVLNRAKIHFTKSSGYYLELYIQESPKHSWKYIERLYLFNNQPIGYNSSIYTPLTAIGNISARENFRKTLKPQKTSLYEGIVQMVLIQKKHSIFFLSLRPWLKIKDLLRLLFVIIINGTQYIFDLIIKIPILHKYSKKTSKLSIKIGRPEHKTMTAEAFQKLFEILNKLSVKLNLDVDESARINIKKDNGYIIITRRSLSIRIYISGDSVIMVQEHNMKPQSKFTFKYQLSKKILNYGLWHLENYGYISVGSFGVKIMDTFILHSSN